MNEADVVELDSDTAEKLAILAKERGMTAEAYLKDVLLERTSRNLHKLSSLFFAQDGGVPPVVRNCAH